MTTVAIKGLLMICASVIVMLPITQDRALGQDGNTRDLAVSPKQSGAGDSQTHLKAFYDKSWAVVVGINQYPHAGSSGLRNLEYARADAEAVGKTLKTLGFEVTMLVDDKATRQAIIGALSNIQKNAKLDDRIVFYFAGHGITEEAAETSDDKGRAMGYILPSDYDGGADATAISLETLKGLSKKIKAKHMVYLMDSCFAGDMLGTTRSSVSPTSTGGLNAYLQQIMKERAHVVLTAGGKGQKVLEKNGHGVFTSIMLQALSEPRRMPWEKEGYVIAGDLAQHIKKQMANVYNKQSPQYGLLDGQGDVMLALFKAVNIPEATDEAFKQQRLRELEEDFARRQRDAEQELAHKKRQQEEELARQKQEQDRQAAMEREQVQGEREQAAADRRRAEEERRKAQEQGGNKEIFVAPSF